MNTTEQVTLPPFWQGASIPTGEDAEIAEELCRMFIQIEAIGGPGKDRTQGYHRSAWTPEDLRLRAWFAAEAGARGLKVVVDRAGNQWAWWGEPRIDAPGISTGSHLDSVPAGGAFDGPLGVLSAFAALGWMHRHAISVRRPLAIVNFSDEEGARFGIACIGSRAITDAISASTILELEDSDGTSQREALSAAGIPTADYGRDPQALALTSAHLELHVEQGRFLADRDLPVGVATLIWPHGRWRIDVEGVANHAGTTPMEGRRDALVAATRVIDTVNRSATIHHARGTVGRIRVEPGGTNVIPSAVTLWVDVRAEDDATLEAILADLDEWSPVCESRTPATHFDATVRTDVSSALEAEGIPTTPMATAAGHDAGILQDAGVPAGMVFVRNSNGFSHTPQEHATLDDCVAGVHALVAALNALGDRP